MITEDTIIGALLVMLLIVFAIFNSKWNKYSWIGLTMIILPYIHIFTVSDNISDNLRIIYAFIIFGGLALLLAQAK